MAGPIGPRDGRLREGPGELSAARRRERAGAADDQGDRDGQQQPPSYVEGG